MNDGKYPPLTDSMDDLPRTLRREKEARERAQREQQAAAQRSTLTAQPGAYGRTSPVGANGVPLAYDGRHAGAESFPATVVRLRVPFLSLMGFFIKAVFAAIPALLLLIAMLYGLGVVLKTYFPWLVQTEILIRLPK